MDFEKILKGRIIKEIIFDKERDDEIIFILKGGGTYKLYYEPD